MSLELIKQSIQDNFPNFHVERIELAGEGMDSHAFTVNDEYVFRFPKYKEPAEQLEVEIALLPRLQNHLEVAIPHFEYIGKQVDNGLPFVGYRKIKGVALERELLMSLEGSLPTKLVKQIAAFLQQVHTFPTAIARECGVRKSDFKKNYTEDLKRTRRDAYPMLEPQVQSYVEHLFEGYLNNNENFSYTPVLLHADLSPEHIIYDEEARTIAGIIDFGDVEIGDPDYDLFYLWEDYRREFVSRLLIYLPRENERNLFSKLEFFHQCNTIHDVLLGIARQDDIVLRDSLRQLTKQAQQHGR